MSFITRIDTQRNFEEGELIDTFEYCKSNYCKGKCKDFYDKLFQSGYTGFLTCPHGFSVCAVGVGKDRRVYTCFREKLTVNKEKTKRLDYEKTKMVTYNPILSRSTAEKIIIQAEKNFIDNKQLQDKTFIIDNVSHEVNKLNAQIKERCDNIFATYQLDQDGITIDAEMTNKLQQEIRTIYVASSMVFSRFMLYDYESDSKNYLRGQIFDCNVYKKFDKICKIFKNYRKKGVITKIEGNSHKAIKAYQSFEMIPLLIIENAVKYSFPGQTVKINFIERDSDLIVTIESKGPYIPEEEISKLYEKGYRGEQAKQVADGSGIGLYFVKLICDIHGIDINITSDPKRRTKKDNVYYAPFVVTLEMHDTFEQLE